MKLKDIDIGKIADSIGCRAEDLCGLSEEYVNHRTVLAMLFRTIRRTDLLACLITAMAEAGRCSGFLVHEDSTMFIFEDCAADAAESGCFVLSSADEDVYFIHEEQIRKVRPVSFFAGVMCFKLQMENETAMLYLRTSETDECEEVPPLNTGLTQAFYEIDSFEKLRDFAGDIALVQMITGRRFAGMYTYGELVDPDACDLGGMITSIETEKDEITLMTEESPVRISRESFRGISDLTVADHHVYMFDVDAGEEPFSLLFDADPCCPRGTLYAEDEDDGEEREPAGCYLHMTGGADLCRYEQFYSGPNLKSAAAALLEDGVAEEILCQDPAEYLESFEDSFLLAGEDGSRFVCIRRMASAAEMAAVLGGVMNETGGPEQAKDMEDLVQRFNKAGMDLDDFTAEEREKLLMQFDEAHTVILRDKVKDMPPLQKVSWALSHVDVSDGDSEMQEILQEGCTPVFVNDETIVVELALPGYILFRLTGSLGTLEDEINRVLTEKNSEEPRRRLAFIFSREGYGA
jgi:hypothetical protein